MGECSMSWFRQIKVIYSLRILIFIYILWSFFINSIFLVFFDYRLFIIAFGAGLLMQYLKCREVNKHFVLLVPSVLGCNAAYIFGMRKPLEIILCAIFLWFYTYMLYKFDDENIKYNLYVYRAKRAVIALVLISPIFLINFYKNFPQNIGKLCIFYLIILIISLRESRAYEFGVKNKRNIWGNIISVIAILLLSLDSVFEALMFAIKFLLKYVGYGCYYVLLTIVKLMSYLIGYPLLWLIQKIMSMIQKKGKSATQDTSLNNSDKLAKLLKKASKRQFNMPYYIQVIIGIALLLIILYIVIRLMRFEQKRAAEKYSGDTIEIEKIEKSHKKVKGSFIDMVRDIFASADLRSQVISMYRAFEKMMSIKGIFKKYMTASQLSNIAASKVSDRAPLDTIANIYNECKFSEHEVTKKHLDSIKENCKNIKNEL
jgi:hypothetical protein